MAREKFTDSLDFDPNEHSPNLEKGAIFEIGPLEVNGIPYLFEEIEETIKSGVLYVAVDRFRDQLPDDEFGENIVGELENLPFKSDCADQIWLMNVFGEDQFSWRSSGDEWKIRNRYLQELLRVIKPDGMVIIGEGNTPAVWLLGEDFTRFGLKKEVLFRERAREFIRKYRITNDIVVDWFEGLRHGV